MILAMKPFIRADYEAGPKMTGQGLTGGTSLAVGWIVAKASALTPVY